MRKGSEKLRFCLLLIAVVILFDWILADQVSQPARESDAGVSVSDAQISGTISREIRFFPIAAGKEEDLTFDFADTWMAERTYGGDRVHEGCDIIPSVDQRGICPVVSMTDGVIENLGWLTLGGYRIGIRSDSGVYYYYAHLESYAEGLAEGQEILAGEFLGFVGDSGYGGEGTTGQFVTHLHIGIYVPDEDGEDAAVNPYPYLDAVRGTQVQAEYTVGI